MQLINLKHYRTLELAYRDKEILYKNGIESFLADDLDIDMLERVNGIAGYLNLFVDVNDLENAQQLLAITVGSTLSIDYKINNSPYNHTCPKCGSNHLFKIERDGGTLLGYFLDKILSLIHNQYKCFYCEHEWKKYGRSK